MFAVHYDDFHVLNLLSEGRWSLKCSKGDLAWSFNFLFSIFLVCLKGHVPLWCFALHIPIFPYSINLTVSVNLVASTRKGVLSGNCKM